MSIVAVARDGKRVCMACDSQGTNNGSIVILHGSKIVRRGKFLFGVCDGNTAQTIRHLIEMNAEDWDPEISSIEAFEWWVHGRFLPALRKVQRTDQVLPTIKEAVQETRAQIMIAHGPRFVCVDTVGFVVCPEAPYHATGSGWCEARCGRTISAATWSEPTTSPASAFRPPARWTTAARPRSAASGPNRDERAG